ncbi:MAG: hypothetical protein U0531_13935 [Dehalococcoidia bacterium]
MSITGPVQGAVMAAGGTVTIGSAVDGTVRAAGGTVNVDGQTRKDLLVGAGQLAVRSSARIGGDLIFRRPSIWRAR